MEDYLTPAAAAALARVSLWTVYKAIERKALKAERKGGRIFIHRDALTKWGSDTARVTFHRPKG